MSSKPDKKPDFETALAELEGLVSRLESGDLSLDQSLACFKRGVELTRHCQSVLDEAQKNVELLTTDADGQAGIEASD
jgi:exodeoxyribonuclease VII small subunit